MRSTVPGYCARATSLATSGDAETLREEARARRGNSRSPWLDLGEPLAEAPIGNWQRAGRASMWPPSLPGRTAARQRYQVGRGRHLFDVMCQLVGISWIFFL